MNDYKLKDFVNDLLETDDVVELLNSDNKSWSEIAGGFIIRNPNVTIEEDEYQQEILTPYLEELEELLNEYDVEGFCIDFVEALRDRDAETLVWAFKDTNTGDTCYVYSVKVNNFNKWVSSLDHPVLTGDLNPSLLSPHKHWKVHRKG